MEGLASSFEDEIVRLLGTNELDAAWTLAVQRSTETAVEKRRLEVELDVELRIDFPAHAAWCGWAVEDIDTALRRAIAAADELVPVADLLMQDELPVVVRDSHSGLLLVAAEDGSLKLKFKPVDHLHGIAASKPLVILAAITTAVTSVGWVVTGIEHIRGTEPPAQHQPAPTPPVIININTTITVTINDQRVRINAAPRRGWRHTGYREFKL